MKNIKLIMILFALGGIYSCSSSEEKNEEVVKVDSSVEKTTNSNEDKGQASVAVSEGEDANALQVAKSLEDFSTLVAAIEAAGVEDAVVNAGPLTIFAPLNSAFDKLPEGTVADLVKPENKEKLTFILINHVAPSNYPINQLKKEAKKQRKLYMASGKYLNVENRDDGIYVENTKILKSVKVSNGWIHVIDDVLVPADN